MRQRATPSGRSIGAGHRMSVLTAVPVLGLGLVLGLVTPLAAAAAPVAEPVVATDPPVASEDDGPGTSHAPTTDDVLQVPAPVVERCTDPLLVVAPGLAQGDARAVAITSQTLDADLPGWEHLSWQAGDETTITAITVQTVAGFTTITGDLQQGTLEGVLELTFCGTLAATEVDEDAAELGPATPALTAPAPAPPARPSSGTPTAARSVSPEATARATPATPSTAQAGDDVASLSSPEDEVAEVTVDDAPVDRATASTGTRERTSTPAEPAIQDDDTEVLGVQFSRSADDDGTSGGLVALLLTGVVATAAGALAWLRRRAVTARDTGGLGA